MAWKPVPRAGVDLKALPLSPTQGYLVSRLDGASDLAALAQVTGLPADRVEALLGQLVAMGAVEPEGPQASTPSSAALLDEGAEPAGTEPEPELPADDDDAPPEEPEPGTHRKLFETALHARTADERTAMAASAIDPELSALCFDPLPAVVKALLDNPRFGLTQARLVARHHHNPVGLEAMAARAAFAADAGVRRALVQNPQLPASLFRRLWQGKRLLEQYKLVVSRELPEQTKRSAREVLRARFASGPAEERVELIMKTEARCLAHLTGLGIDSKTTALLCARTYGSTLFVQNLARWSAAPPPLIAHLLRQELVKRSPQLRTLLERHPNAPHH